MANIYIHVTCRIEAFNEDIAAANEYTLIGAIEEVPLPVRAPLKGDTAQLGQQYICSFAHFVSPVP
jgi:hypothetical protein